MDEPPPSDGRRAPGSDSGRPACDWEAAFFYYATLPRQLRHYAAVAEKFAVSERTVETHGAKEHWLARAAAIDARAAAEADERLARSRGERIAEDERLIDKSLVYYEAQLNEGGVEFDAADAVRLIRLRAELRRDSAAAATPITESPEWLELKTKLLDGLADDPEARAKVAAVLEESAREE
jgi:hypothetical protein